ncbi:hypothetical protein BB561_002017 [Smittium simulii]|uniref:Uncharacterized protein n=1 Tax=Smittium simulii TaxID=133385 RepID=A0A2T9YS31_9FUNG|nr:hypothetical protein BB561_002017 [Smittium simulii]
MGKNNLASLIGQQDQPIKTEPADAELPHILARASVTDLIYYPELLEKIINNPGTKNKEDSNITFALEVRLLLTVAAFIIIQLIRELIYNNMTYKKKSPKLVEKTNYVLFEPKQLYINSAPSSLGVTYYTKKRQLFLAIRIPGIFQIDMLEKWTGVSALQ